MSAREDADGADHKRATRLRNNSGPRHPWGVGHLLAMTTAPTMATSSRTLAFKRGEDKRAKQSPCDFLVRGEFVSSAGFGMRSSGRALACLPEKHSCFDTKRRGKQTRRSLLGPERGCGRGTYSERACHEDETATGCADINKNLR